jgi:hypothetical protein
MMAPWQDVEKAICFSNILLFTIPLEYTQKALKEPM